MFESHLLLCYLSTISGFVDVVVGHTAIIGGNRAEEHQFPYQVSVQLRDHNVCGGGIIGNFHIVTAAHCILNDDDRFMKGRLYIVAGTNVHRQRNAPAVIIDVKRSYIPAEYNVRTLETTGDIAVLKLKHSLEGHKHLEQLKLPASKREDYANKRASIAGFGWTRIRYNARHETGTNDDKSLRYAYADVLTNDQCTLDYKTTKIADEEICARVIQDPDSMKGVCNGDSGSLLVHEKTAIGVLILTALGCSERQKPAIYTRISHYLQFIDDAIHDRNNTDIRTHDHY